jgi:hypothetical protein
MVRKIFNGLFIFVVLIILVGFMLPSKFHIERKISINTGNPKVFAAISNLKAWENWVAWKANNPEMQIQVSEPAEGVGALMQWKSKKSGDGKLKITAVTPGKEVRYRVFFSPDPNDEGVEGSIKITEKGGNQEVIWEMAGDWGFNPVGRYIGMIFEHYIAQDFEQGLQRLKVFTEKN